MASRMRPSRPKGVLYRTRVARLDDDVVQFTPPGSGCSISFGKGVRRPGLGSLRGQVFWDSISRIIEEQH
jgi:hypothetical protein